MSPPDSTIALLSGSSEITCVFGVPPFQQQQLEKPGIHTILNSFDIMDGPHTFTVAWTSARFRDKNPVLYKALVGALKEATEIVDKDRKKAAGYWIEDVKSKLPLDKVTAVVSGPQVRWTMAPENTMKFAAFMHSVGSLTGPAAVAKSEPDGYPLLIAVSGHTTNPALYATMQYDGIKDFEPIALLARTPVVLYAHPSLPAKDTRELIALGKAKTHTLN